MELRCVLKMVWILLTNVAGRFKIPYINCCHSICHVGLHTPCILLVRVILVGYFSDHHVGYRFLNVSSVVVVLEYLSECLSFDFPGIQFCFSS